MQQPTPSTILLLGKNGQVGWELARTLAPLGPAVAVGREDVDLTEEAEVRALVRRVRPGIIVNASAYTAVDRAEEEPERALAVNGRGPAVLAEAAREVRALLVHYSTDYVFDGTKREPYTEEDAPHPINVYGRSKLEGEQGIQAAGGAHVILRTSWVYSLRRHNFFLTMLRLAHQQVPLRVIDTQFGAPTPAWLIAEATASILARWGTMSPAERPQGLFHLTAAQHTSWHGFAEAIFENLYGSEAPAVAPITPEEYPTPAARPEYSVLSCAKLECAFGLVMPSWRDALQRVCDEIRYLRQVPAYLLGERE